MEAALSMLSANNNALLTTCEEFITMVSEHADDGVEGIVVIYNERVNADIKAQIPFQISIVGCNRKVKTIFFKDYEEYFSFIPILPYRLRNNNKDFSAFLFDFSISPYQIRRLNYLGDELLTIHLNESELVDRKNANDAKIDEIEILEQFSVFDHLGLGC